MLTARVTQPVDLRKLLNLKKVSKYGRRCDESCTGLIE